MYKRGSVWWRWDLHIHTPKSIIQDYGGDTEAAWDNFIDKLKTLPPEIQAIGITDYFFIDGYEKLLERRSQLSNIKLILPNIEFRLNTFSGTANNNKRHNFHVIFDPSVTPEIIREQLLNCLSRAYKISDGTEWNQTPTTRSLEQLGREIKSAAPEDNSIRSKTDLQVGFDNITYKIDDILENLKKDPFKNKYVTCVGYSEWDQSRWDQSAAEKRDLINKADFCLTSLDDVDAIKTNQKELIKNKINRIILHSSDAHNIRRLGETKLWIKADPTFEGLRQLMYEPSERIAIQEEDPTPVRSSYTFEELSFEKKVINDELTICRTKVKLNKGLIALAGGKGSGKTAFVDLIAHCFEDRNKQEYENSFVYRVCDQAPDLKVKVKFKDGTEFKKRIGDESFFQECEYLYIPQGELEKYVSKEDLNQYAHNLIIDSPKVKESLPKYEYFKLQHTINNLSEEIKNISIQIENLIKQTGKEVSNKLLLKKKQLEASIKDIETRLIELEDGLDKLALQKVKKIQEDLNKLKDKKALLTNLYTEFDEARKFIEIDIGKFNQIITKINVLLKEAEIPPEFKKLEYEDAEEILERAKTIDSEIREIIKQVQIKEDTIRKFELRFQTHTKLLGSKKDFENGLKIVEGNIVELIQKREGLKNLNKIRLKKYGEVIQNTIELQKKYKDMINIFSGDRAGVLKDLEFLPRMSFDKKSFLIKAEDVLDNRKADVKEIGESVIFKNFLELIKAILSGDTNIANILKEISLLEADLSTKVKFSSAITIRDFFDFLYDNYLSVEPVIKYKGVELRRLSLGQKATVLIKIYLAEGDKPIIIDSHDDYLDNKYIMDELINAIREARKSRQIILVSNNGNVVVNSDAEQVIIADKNDDGEISYFSGSLENPQIIDKAIEVLEGGKEAFKNRQRKYRMS